MIVGEANCENFETIVNCEFFSSTKLNLLKEITNSNYLEIKFNFFASYSPNLPHTLHLGGEGKIQLLKRYKHSRSQNIHTQKTTLE